MATPVNLNRARKDKARAEKKARADENVVKFGRTKAEKTLTDAQKAKATRDLNGARRDRP